MNTVQLECYMAVAENLNFARAAEPLHITQPAVTHQINSLETELDVKLFKRTTRTVELTSPGWVFLGYARDILAKTAQAKNRLAGHFEDQIQPFIIGCHSSFELTMLPEALRRLTKAYPQVHPDIKMVPSQALRNLLQEETLDVMLGFGEDKEKKKTGTYVELIKAPVVCVTAGDHALAKKDAVTLDELHEGRLVLCDPHKSSPVITEMQGSLISTRPPSQMFFCENIECALAFVKAGLGFTILPDMPLMRSDDLCYIPVKNAAPASFGLYYKTLQNNPVLHSFIRIMKECSQVQKL